MALNAYLKLKGQKQGEIKGSVTQRGREGRIMVIAAEHEVTTPRDAASGLPTGKRMHKPYVITKEIDVASPRLYAALVNNETLPTWELQFWAPSISAVGGGGTEVQNYTVRLTNASICDIRFHMLNNKNPELTRYAEYEEIAFTYQKIEWIWVAGGVSTSDEWEAQTAAPKRAKAAVKAPARATPKRP